MGFRAVDLVACYVGLGFGLQGCHRSSGRVRIRAYDLEIALRFGPSILQHQVSGGVEQRNPRALQQRLDAEQHVFVQ